MRREAKRECCWWSAAPTLPWRRCPF